MLRHHSVIALALTFMAIGTPAAAQNFSPTSGTAPFSGWVTESALTCILSGSVSLSPSTASGMGQTLSPGNPYCGSVILPFGAWRADTIPSSWTTVSLTFGRMEPSRTCYGTITAAWNPSTNTASFTNASLPSVAGVPSPCIVSGTITLTGVDIL